MKRAALAEPSGSEAGTIAPVATIVFDARAVTTELSGLGRYSIGLLRGLSERAHHHRIVSLGGDRDAMQDAIGGAGGIESIACEPGPLSLRSQVFLPRALRRLQADLYHAPYVFAPLRPGPWKTVITVHDLIPLRYPQGVHRSLKERLRPAWNLWCRAQYRRADAIVTVSDFSRAELIEHASIDPAKVHRIYNGVDAPAVGETRSFREQFKVLGAMISYLGRHDPYKNIAAALEAFALLMRDGRREATLVIGGRTDPRYPENEDRAQSLGIADRVVFTGYLDEGMRAALLRESSVFVFPSRYEGFGLPPLEAMAAGVPVVCSNAASLPEVAGDAATMVDPDDVAGLAAAIRDLLDDESLRRRRIDAGREQVSKFTWTRSAEEHLALYERLLA